jgi:hypothetical protein
MIDWLNSFFDDPQLIFFRVRFTSLANYWYNYLFLFFGNMTEIKYWVACQHVPKVLFVRWYGLRVKTILKLWLELSENMVGSFIISCQRHPRIAIAQLYVFGHLVDLRVARWVGISFFWSNDLSNMQYSSRPILVSRALITSRSSTSRINCGRLL